MNRTAENEEGRIGVLFIVLLAIVALTCVVGANIASVHLQHRRALACADAVALAAASAVKEGRYFCDECESGNLLVHEVSLQVAREELRALAHSTCEVGEGVTVKDVVVVGNDVWVDAQVRSVLPVVPGVLNSFVAPTLRVEGQGRLVVGE